MYSLQVGEVQAARIFGGTHRPARSSAARRAPRLPEPPVVPLLLLQPGFPLLGACRCGEGVSMMRAGLHLDLPPRHPAPATAAPTAAALVAAAAVAAGSDRACPHPAGRLWPGSSDPDAAGSQRAAAAGRPVRQPAPGPPAGVRGWREGESRGGGSRGATSVPPPGSDRRSAHLHPLRIPQPLDQANAAAAPVPRRLPGLPTRRRLHPRRHPVPIEGSRGCHSRHLAD